MTDILSNFSSEPDQSEVREQLNRILKSASFTQSRRRQRFLEYIVEETLAGRGDRLKGYNVALEVFDRPKSFDPGIDPLVRIEAGRLRDKLREYYDADGQADPIRIELPKGAYAPLIERRQSARPEAKPASQVSTHADIGAQVAPEFLPEGPVDIASSILSSSVQTKLRIAAVVVLVITIGAIDAWRSRDVEPVLQANSETRASSDGPAIAVLPFANLSGDPKQEYFSDGLTEDILTELTRTRALRVLARNTTFQFKGQAVDVPKLGRELKVRYVLEGSIQRAADRLRITTQLIDTESGAHIWADRYERAMTDVFLVQDDIVNQIVAKIAGSYGVIETAEAKWAARKSPEEIQSYDLVLRARQTMRFDWTAETIRTARDTLNQAIALDQSNAQARRELAWLAILGWVFQLDATPAPPQDILMHATKAAQLNPTDARTRMVAASAYFFTQQLDLFKHEADQALALAPYDAEIMAVLGCMISSAGDHARGVDLAKKANALNPGAASGWYHATVYIADYLNGDYERALEVARQNQDPEMFYTYIEIIPIYGQLGRKTEAFEAWKKLLDLVPGASAASFESWWRLWNYQDEDLARLMDGVHKSGVLGAQVYVEQ